LVITSTPAGRFICWTDQKPADLTDDNSCCVTYLRTRPFQEGTPLTPIAEEYSPTEVATTDSSLCTSDCVVFVATVEVGTSEARVDRYLDDILDDEVTIDTPADETIEAKNAWRIHNHKRAD
jgi:hypothetical protein